MFKGSMVAMVTPLNPDQSLDLKGLERVVDFHIENQTDALVIIGTTGESAVLTKAEKETVIKATLEQVNGQIPVIAGTAAQSTAETIDNTKKAQALGCNGALIMTPAYIKPPQRCLIAHYQAIATHTDLPLILYNVPGRTACDLLPETALELSKIDNIVAIKEASGSVERTKQIIDYCGNALDVLSGEDSLSLELMKLGAKGVISVTANIAPKLMHQMCDFALNEQWQSAQEINKKLKPLHDVLFIESNPIPTKWAMSQMDLCNSTLRLPLLDLELSYHKNILEVLETL